MCSLMRMKTGKNESVSIVRDFRQAFLQQKSVNKQIGTNAMTTYYRSNIFTIDMYLWTFFTSLVVF